MQGSGERERRKEKNTQGQDMNIKKCIFDKRKKKKE